VTGRAVRHQGEWEAYGAGASFASVFEWLAGRLPEIQKLREQIAETDRQLASYRAALDGGGDPAVIGAWITETQARKLAARARLDALRGTSPARLTSEEIAAMVNATTDIATLLGHADPADKAELYGQLGLRLTYHPA
jgi:site-specific DNA recombinase